MSVAAFDAEGRERLLRHCARPPLSLERLRVLEDGRIAYFIRQARSRHTAVRIMTPMQFLAR